MRSIIVFLAVFGIFTSAGFESAYAMTITLDATDNPPTYYDDHGITFYIENLLSSDTSDNTIDTHSVKVNSSADANGCMVSVTESGANTGKYIFSSYVMFTTTGSTNCAVPMIKVNDGGTVIVNSWDGITTSSATVLNPCYPANACSASNLPAPGPQPYLDVNYDCGPQGIDPDGLCKSWKQSNGLVIQYQNTTDQLFLNSGNGYTVTFTYLGTCSTNPDDCPHLGGKDIYIELDKLLKHGPNQISIADVVGAFKSQGIYLHILLDDVIPFHKDVYSAPSGGSGGQDFDKIKSVYFGTSTERTTTPSGCPTTDSSTQLWKNCISSLLTAKRLAFHYVLFAHKSQSTNNPSGTSELPGNDIMITLGSFTGGKGSQTEQEGTLMHELGHNLGLNHGGPYSIGNGGVNCKPNYPSVMSYTHQFTNYISNRALDYSHGTAGDITGNLYNETIGVGAGGSSLAMVWNYGSMITRTANSQGQVDWNNDGQIVRTQAGTGYNLNAIGGSSGCGTNSLPYNNYNDWNNLIFGFQGYATFGDGAPSPPPSPPGLVAVWHGGGPVRQQVPRNMSQVEDNSGISFERYNAGFTLQIQSLSSAIGNLPESSFGNMTQSGNKTSYYPSGKETKMILQQDLGNASNLISQGAAYGALQQLHDVKSKVMGSSDAPPLISDVESRTNIVMSIDNLVGGIFDGYQSDFIPPKTLEETFVDPFNEFVGNINKFLAEDHNNSIFTLSIILAFIVAIISIGFALGIIGHKYRNAKKRLREAGLDKERVGGK